MSTSSPPPAPPGRAALGREDLPARDRPGTRGRTGPRVEVTLSDELNPGRVVLASPLLVHFRIGTTNEDEEDDVSAEIRAWHEIHQQKLRDEGRDQGRDEGRDEGRKEGRDEGERRVILRQLRARFGELPAAAVARIEAAEVAELERWADRVLGAQTLDEVLAEPS